MREKLCILLYRKYWTTNDQAAKVEFDTKEAKKEQKNKKKMVPTCVEHQFTVYLLCLLCCAVYTSLRRSILLLIRFT
jgi:hypothetical protein